VTEGLLTDLPAEVTERKALSDFLGHPDPAVLAVIGAPGSGKTTLLRHTARQVLRITDHKTGKPLERPPAFVGGGKALQPLLYSLAASILLGQPVESGRLFYSTQRGGYQQMGVPVNDRARGFLARFLGDVDGSIAGGFLPPAPEKDACEYCDYRVVCGPYEEQRTVRKDRRDERMEALIEIRGMA